MNKKSTDNRLVLLESESATLKDEVSKLSDVQISIASSLAELSSSNTSIVSTLEKVNTTMERFRDFEVVTETERKSEREHRDRLDRRVDEYQRDLTNTRRDCEEGFDKVYASQRKSEIRLADKINDLDKKHTEKISDLDKRLEVKTGVDNVKHKTTEKTIKVRGDRMWKIGFWLMAALFTMLMTSKTITGG